MSDYVLILLSIKAKIYLQELNRICSHLFRIGLKRLALGKTLVAYISEHWTPDSFHQP